MNIVHSFWSLPSSLTNSVEDRNNGGWLSEKYHAMSWALSCLKFKQFYNQVHLFTDKFGEDWLINKLNLPYSRVDNSLDALNCYSPTLWSLSKLYSYTKQTAPFLHVDSDVYVWKPFAPSFCKAGLVVQNFEMDVFEKSRSNLYITALLKMVKEFSFVPEYLKKMAKHVERIGKIKSINAGIIGGNDVLFFKNYSSTVFEFLEANKKASFSGKDMFVTEQLFFYALARQAKKTIKPLFGIERSCGPTSYNNFIYFNRTPFVNKYIHVVGNHKKSEILCTQIAERLRQEFPKIYKHINILYPTRQVYTAKEGVVNEHKTVIDFFANTVALLNTAMADTLDSSIVNSYRPFKNWVIKNCRKNEKICSLIGDVFQIEDAIYTLHKQATKAPQTHTKDSKKIYDLIYTKTDSKIMSVKLSLNNDKCYIVYLTGSFPKNEMEEKFKQRLIEQKYFPTDTEHSTMVLYRLDGYNNLSAVYLKNTEQWLSHFEAKRISGNDLLEIVSHPNRLSKNEIVGLSFSILDFITTAMVYFKYLKIAS